MSSRRSRWRPGEQTTDGHIIVIDPFERLSWECSRFRRLNDGEPACTTFNVWDLTGPGFGVPFQGERWVTRGGRCSGFPEIAGIVRPEEIEASEIRHTLVCSNLKNRKGDKGKVWFVPPASRSDAQYEGEQYPLEGARFQLDPTLTDADFDRWGLGPAAKVMARALQKYGINGQVSRPGVRAGLSAAVSFRHDDRRSRERQPTHLPQQAKGGLVRTGIVLSIPPVWILAGADIRNKVKLTYLEHAGR